MGREVKRVPLDFTFPMGESFYEARYDQHRAECSKEDHDECEFDSNPPTGEGWQLWQTVSDGPVTPVFDSAEKLIDYMSQPCDCGKMWCEDPWPTMPGGKGWRRQVAEKFVRGNGWMPSGIMQGGRMLDTSEVVDLVSGGSSSSHTGTET